MAGKIALVTGASTGIGLAIAQRFATEGAEVFMIARSAAKLELAAGAIGPSAHPIVADVTSSAELQTCFDEVASKAGRLDILVANAGVGEISRLEHLTEASFDRTFDTNVKAVVFTVQKALPLLVNGASVILVGSSGSAKALPSQSVYGASKAALRSFARSWMLELRGRRIRVNVLSPGPVVTETLLSMAGAGEDAEAVFRARVSKTIPSGRLGEVGEIADVALFLASESSSFINGTEMFVDGGHAQT